MSHQRKASALSFLGGALCGLGWLMLVDALCVGGFLTSGAELYTSAMTATPVLLATLFILTLNTTSVDDMRESYFSYGFWRSTKIQKISMRISCFLGLCSVVGSVVNLVYGSWTGRPPRQTWLDGVVIAYAPLLFHDVTSRLLPPHNSSFLARLSSGSAEVTTSLRFKFGIRKRRNEDIKNP